MRTLALGGATILALSLAALGGCSVTAGASVHETTAAACGSCHTTEYAAWATSRLASSGTSPVFVALSEDVAAAWGAQAKAECTSCHQPGIGGDHGIGCVACHSATGNLATRDGMLSVDLEGPVSGPFDDPAPTSAHASRTYGFLMSPELCGTCHDVTGPGLFHETTFDEYEASPAATRGGGCASCHMLPVDAGPIAAGATTSRDRWDHGFVGVDPPWGATADVARAAAASTLTLLQSGLGLVVSSAGGQLSITVANGAGHSVPTGVAFLRGIWVDVSFSDALGASSSAPAVIDLGSQPTSNGAPVALVTQADAVAAHALAPGGSVTVRVTPPPSLVPPITAVATLKARAIRPEILDALGLSSQAAAVPEHVVAVGRATL